MALVSVVSTISMTANERLYAQWADRWSVIYIYTHIRLTAPFPEYPSKPVPERQNNNDNNDRLTAFDQGQPG